MKNPTQNRVTGTDILDFYTLALIYSFADEDKDYILELLADLKNKILGECENILLRELRHLGDQFFYNENTEEALHAQMLELKPFIRLLSRTYGAEKDSRGDRYFRGFLTLSQIKGVKTPTQDEIVNLLLEEHWDESYAGREWADFAEYVFSAKNAPDKKTSFLKIDRLINFAHHNGTMLDKFYYGNNERFSGKIWKSLVEGSKLITGSSEIEASLDIHSKMKFPHQFVNICSPAVLKLFREACRSIPQLTKLTKDFCSEASKSVASFPVLG